MSEHYSSTKISSAIRKVREWKSDFSHVNPSNLYITEMRC